MGVGRKTIKNIVGSTTFAALTDVDVAGSQQGTVLFYNGSKWVDLAPATANQVLTTNGAGANPSWTNKTSATGIVGGTDRMVQFNDGGSTFGGVAFFEFQKLTNNLMVSGSSGYSYSAKASGSSQTTSGLDVFNYDNSQVLQVGHNNLTNESYVWATQTSNNLKFGTNNIKRMEILASNGKIFTTNDFHVSGTLTAGTATLIGTDTLWNAKGDLAVGTGSDTAVRVSIGSDGKVLTADSTTTSGVDWVTPAAAASTNDLRIPVGSSSGGGLATKFVSSPFIIDPAGGPYADGNVVMTSDGSNVSSAGLGKLALITETGSTSFASVASGAAATVARLGSITNHTSTVEFLHNGKEDILSKIVMTSGTTTIGAESPHKFILTGGLGITAQSTKPTDSTTKPAIWVSGTSNLLYLSDVGMVTANSSVLSAGYVPYVSGAAKNGVGNSVLYNDATNSRIGINTASPNRAFDVRGTSLLSGNTKVVGTGEITSTLDVGSNITGTGTATFKTASLTNIVLDPTTRAAFIKLQDSSRTTTTASRNPEILLNQVLVDSGSDKADFPTIRFTKGGPVAADASYTNLGYRIYVSGETGAGTVNAPQAMIWDFNSDIADPANYIEKLALTTTGGLRINNAYTLPTAVAGSNGYVITGNTDGTTGWAAQSGGGGVGGYWGLNGSKIHYTSGNVGIGTTDPDALLTVKGTSDNPIAIYSGSGDTTFHYKTTGSGDISFQYHVNSGRSADIALISNADSAEKTTIRQKVIDADNSEILFRTRDAGTLTNTMILSGSKVGIGTTTPAYTLDVSSGYANAARLYLNEANNYIMGESDNMYLRAHNDMYFNIDTPGDSVLRHFIWRANTSSELMRLGEDGILEVKSGGKVGIGTAGPDGILEVIGSNGTVAVTPESDAEELVIRNNHRAGISILSSESASRGGYLVFGGATDSNAANIHHDFSSKTFSFQGQNPDMQLRFASANNVEAMRIDTSQNVGIGTTEPSMPLNVSGTQYDMTKIASSHAAGVALYLDADATGGSLWHLQSTANSAGTGGGKLDFVEAGTSRMVIAGGGNVGIGTTAPNHKLDVLGHISASSSTAANAIYKSNGYNFFYNDGTSAYLYAATSDLRILNYSDGATSMIVKNKKVGIGTATPTAELDVRGDSSAGMAAFVSGTGNGTYPVMHVIDSADTEVAWFEGNRAGDTGAYIGVRHWPASATENARSGVKFQSKDDGGALTNYATILMRVDDFTGGTEDGTLRFEVMADGTSTEIGRFYSAGFRVEDGKYLAAGTSSDLFLYHDGNSTIRSDTGALQINQNTSSDFSLNSNGGDIIIDSNIYNKNGGNVGIGTTGPDAKLDVLSTTEQLRLTHTDASKYMSTAVDSAGSTTWTNQKSFRFTGAATSGSMQIDLNKISLVRDATSAVSNVLQIGDGGTYDQFSIVEDQRGSTATNGYIKLRAKKTGNFGYRKVSLNAISGSNTSELFIDSISTNEALRFDTETKTHALDIAKAGYVSIGASVTTTDALYVNGNTTINGVLSATAKSFDIPHPDKEGMRLVHGSLEGPEHGVYARGTAKGHGETTIELPDYWKTLVGDNYTLQLTSYNSSNIYIVEKEATSFTINSNSLNYKFDYVVIGRREEIEVEQNGN